MFNETVAMGETIAADLHNVVPSEQLNFPSESTEETVKDSGSNSKLGRTHIVMEPKKES
jgi:hypothetical protein